MEKRRFGIVCFGRGIEKAWDLRCSAYGCWQPTAYLEKLTPKGQHSGFRTHELKLDSEDDNVVIAESYVNMMATKEIMAEFYRINSPPCLLVWAGGRPKYLEFEPSGINEGFVLLKEYENRFGKICLISPNLRVELSAQNKNTRDDLLQSLAMAKEMGLEELIVVSIFLHLPRIGEFLYCARKEAPQFNDINVKLIASELILLGKGRTSDLLLLDYPETGIGTSFDHLVWARIVESPVYRRTAAREAKGIADLRAGQYNFTN